MLSVDRILFPTDFSTCAERAYRHAAHLADHFGATLHVLHVVEDESSPVREWPDAPGIGHLAVTVADVCADLGLPLPDQGAENDALADVEVVDTEVVGRDAAEAILDIAYDEEVDLVVMGTHGRTGWRRGVLGSVAERVTRRAPCPVLTVRPLEADGTWPPQRVLGALDVDLDSGGNEDLTAAPQWAAQLASAYRVPLDLVHVTDPAVQAIAGDDAARRTKKHALEALSVVADAIRESVSADLEVRLHVRTGAPADAVRALADETKTHLLVVGTHGRRGPTRALLGSVAESLVREAPCPVLVVRDILEGATRESEAERETQS